MAGHAVVLSIVTECTVFIHAPGIGTVRKPVVQRMNLPFILSLMATVTESLFVAFGTFLTAELCQFSVRPLHEDRIGMRGRLQMSGFRMAERAFSRRFFIVMTGQTLFHRWKRMPVQLAVLSDFTMTLSAFRASLNMIFMKEVKLLCRNPSWLCRSGGGMAGGAFRGVVNVLVALQTDSMGKRPHIGNRSGFRGVDLMTFGTLEPAVLNMLGMGEFQRIGSGICRDDRGEKKNEWFHGAVHFANFEK